MLAMHALRTESDYHVACVNLFYLKLGVFTSDEFSLLKQPVAAFTSSAAAAAARKCQ